MFASLKEQPADKILALMQMFKDDPRGTENRPWGWCLQGCAGTHADHTGGQSGGKGALGCTGYKNLRWSCGRCRLFRRDD